MLKERDFINCEECSDRILLPHPRQLEELPEKARRRVTEENAVADQRTGYQRALVLVKAIARDRRCATPTCFVSYAWGEADAEQWVARLAKDLSDAGVHIVLDRWDNVAMGSNVARFVERIASSDYVVVVGTTAYRRKYENKISESGSVVAAEVDLINDRLLGTEEEKSTVLPLLVEGTPGTAFSPLVGTTRLHGDFRDHSRYFPNLLDLVLTLYRLPFREEAVQAAREIVRPRVRLTEDALQSWAG
jgi:hypothetical protein